MSVEDGKGVGITWWAKMKGILKANNIEDFFILYMIPIILV